MSSSNLYSFLPNNSIRLLKLGANIEGKLQCELHQFTFDTAPDYVALSYAWGNPNTSERIACNNYSFPVTPHLLGALLHLRSFDPQTIVWIDAICINQNNDHEKAIHTRRMDRVYNSAKMVFVWLGESRDGSDLALNHLESINEKLEPILQIDTPERAIFLNGWLRGKDLASSGLPIDDDPIWSALGDLYSRSWLNRLWVLQEVALAKQLVVALGNRRIAWDLLVTLASRLSRATLTGLIGAKEDVNDPIRRSMLSLAMLNIARNFKSSNVYTIPALMRIGRLRDVTVPVDKIYGLLGLVDSNFASQIVVDYSWEAQQNWWKAYIQYTLLQLQSEGTLLLLSMAASQFKPAEMPSWCPNFNSPPKDSFNLTAVNGYQAGFQRIEDRTKPCMLLGDVSSKTIKLQGFRVDHVNEVVGSSQYAFEAEPMKGPSGTAALLLEYEEKCLKVSQNACNVEDEIPEAHWRTLVGDVNIMLRYPLESMVLNDYLRLKQQWISHSDENAVDFVDVLSDSERQANLDYYQAIEAKSSRSFFSTEGGRIGLGPCDLQVGDTICVLYGGAPLFVLREDSTGKAAILVGDAFVYGLMDLKSIPAGTRGKDEYFTFG